MKKNLLTACVGLCCAMLCLAAPTLASAQPTPLAFAQCDAAQVLVVAPGLQCATLAVPLDRADPTLGNVALAVQRVPPSAPRVGVIVLLAGGPGQPALPAFQQLLAPLASLPALAGYELVAFDQRGTGESDALSCPEGPRATLEGPTSYFAACGEALGPTRADYTSQESVEDLDALRQALGGSPLSLFAVSYGGRVAGMYAREHPQGVARMVLDSPVPLAGTDALYSQREHALPRVLDEGICGTGACRSFSANPYTDLARLVAALHRRPMHTRIFNSHGRLQATTVTEVGVYNLVSLLDLSAGLRAVTPAAFSAAAHGNAAPLARLTHGLQGEGVGNDIAAGTSANASLSLALFAATYCVENSLPWSSDSAPGGRAATLQSWLSTLPAGVTSPFAGSTIASGAPISLCLGWPATASAPADPTGVSATPTLILSGDDDLREPYEQDLTVATGYSQGQLLRIPDTGHSTVSTDENGCAQNAMIAFLTSGQAPATCPASKAQQAMPLPPASLSKVRPARSSSRLAGQGAAAAAITLEDLFGQSSLAGGGLRGGSWKVQGARLVLHDTVDVPGVVISGSIALQTKLSGTLTLSGRVHGKLALHGITLSGRLDGARVQARLVGP